MSKITTCLWFDNQAEEAANFYVNTFLEGGREAKLGKISRYDDASAEVSGKPKGSVLVAEFQIDGSSFMALNGGPQFKFTMATSFVIDCETQKEVDYFWEKLTEGGKESQCGWIENDKFGVSWQVVPTVLNKLLSDPDPRKAGAAMKAMLNMKKLDIETLKKSQELV